MENRTAGIIQETRKHIKKKSSGSVAQNEYAKQPQMQQQVRTTVQADQEIQLKASRDVRWLFCVTGSYDGCTFLFALLVLCYYIALEASILDSFNNIKVTQMFLACMRR